MEKKVYIMPSVKVVNIISTTHMLQASTQECYVTADADCVLSRESNGGWDDEEEEEDTSGWFK